MKKVFLFACFCFVFLFFLHFLLLQTRMEHKHYYSSCCRNVKMTVCIDLQICLQSTAENNSNIGELVAFKSASRRHLKIFAKNSPAIEIEGAVA